MFGFKTNKADKKKFEELVTNRINVLYRIAYSYFRDREAASDAVQDSILIALKSFQSLKAEEKFNSWITTILVNRCREILRRRNRINFEEYEDKVIDIETVNQRLKSDYSKIDDKLYIMKYLNEIDVKYSEVISLKYLGDYTIEETAKILDIPQGTVKSRLNKGIKMLRSLMEVKGDAM
jgi:RNA polymerase sigma-70 factor (ECF subfamily)